MELLWSTINTKTGKDNLGEESKPMLCSNPIKFYNFNWRIFLEKSNPTKVTLWFLKKSKTWPLFCPLSVLSTASLWKKDIGNNFKNLPKKASNKVLLLSLSATFWTFIYINTKPKSTKLSTSLKKKPKSKKNLKISNKLGPNKFSNSKITTEPNAFCLSIIWLNS